MNTASIWSRPGVFSPGLQSKNMKISDSQWRNIMKRFILMVLLMTLLLSACASQANEAPSGKLEIVTTTGMIADLAKNIGGEHVHVTALMGPGVDPHLYKASEGDVQLLQGADVIFYNGLHLEA